MKLGMALLLLLALLGMRPGPAICYAMVDSNQAEGNPAFFMMLQRNAQATSMRKPPPNGQARRNQEVLDALSRPPTSWAHYDHPRLGAPAANYLAVTTEPPSNLWAMLIGALLLGCGVTFATALVVQRRAVSRRPKSRIFSSDDPTQRDR